MATPGTALTYEGPQALIVELQREVNGGDVLLEVPDEIAQKLLLAQGFRASTKAEVKRAEGSEGE